MNFANKKYLGEIIGWYGAAAIVVAYALVSFSVITPTDMLYQVLNLTGGIGIIINSFLHKAYPPGILNTIWSIIAIIAILKIIF